MPSLMQIIYLAPALLTVAYAQGVITSAQGTSGSPASLPLQVDLTKSDANIIRSSEITGNVVNECGRTLLGGNIDVGANTEDQLANKTVTSVTKGGTVNVVISQLNADGAGPYSCDLDPTNNSLGAAGQTNLTVTEVDPKNDSGDITLALTMPSDLACTGSSTGNICAIRCFNTAKAGPFGGCFAVQQTDVTPGVNSPATITTASTLDQINSQVAEDVAFLPAAMKANADATTGQDPEQGLLLVDDLLTIDSAALATAGIPSATAVAAAASAATTTSAASAKDSKKDSKKAAKAAAKAAKKAAKDAAAKSNAAKNNKVNKRTARVFVS